MGILTQTHNGLNFLGTEAYIQADGSTKMTIKSDGNVGIGTTSPHAKLVVNGNIDISDTDNGTFRIYNGSTFRGGWGTANWAGANFGDSSSDLVAYVNGSNKYFIGTNAQPRLTVDGTGNVGIGTTSPSAKFVVNNNGGTGSTFYVDAGNKSSTQTLFEHTGSSTPVPFAISKSGYSGNSAAFGILYLDMAHNTAGGGANMHFTLRDSNSNVTEYGGLGATIVTNTDGSESGRLNFYTTNGGSARQNRMVISPAGNVGIGTTSPNSWAQLETTGTVAVGGILYIKSSQKIQGLTGFPGSAGNLSINPDGGNVGIGTTSPGAKLEVASTGSNGSSGLSDYGFVVTTSNGTDQPTLGAESTGDGYANLNLGSNISGTRRFWHISKRKANDSHKLSFFYYNGTSFSEPFHFETNGVLNVNGADINSTKINNWDTAYGWGNHASAGYLTSVPSEYLTQNEGDARYVSFEKVDRAVPNTGGWYRLAKISRGAGRFSISYTGGNMSPHTYVIDAFKNWNNEATIAVEKFGHANYITSFRISRADGAGNNDYYLEGYFSSITNTHSFEARFQEILGYNNISEIFDVSSSSTLVASTAADDETIESLTTTTAEGLYLKNMNLDGRLNLYTDSNTTSSTALVLNGTEVEKRTLGSAAFSASTDFVSVTGDTMTGNLVFGSQYGVRFNDSNTRIYTNTDSPEDLIIEADQDCIINPDGNVGIGTTSPNEKLHVEGTSRFGGDMHFTASASGLVYTPTESSSGQDRYFLMFDTTNGASYPFLTNRTPSGAVVIKTGTAAGGGENEHFRIKGGDGTVDAYFTNANVGIGTTSPGAKLDVAGPAIIQGGAHSTETTDGYGLEIMGNYTDGRWNHRFVKHDDGAGVPLYVQKTSGTADVWSNIARFGSYSGNTNEFEVFGDAKVTNLGINAGAQDYLSSLSARLAVGGNVVINHNTPLIYLRSNSSGNDSDIRYQTALKFTNGAGSTHAYINSSGNVGIGTTSPSGKLMVQDDAAGSVTKMIVSNGGTVQSGTAARLSFYEGTAEKSYIERRRDGTGQTAFVTPADDNPFVFENATGEFLRMINGNVGIGTTSPSTKLHIEGDGSIIRLQNNNSDTNGTFIDFRDSAGVRTGYVGTTGTSDDMFLFTQGSKPIRFYTNASERMRVASSGNVGIGTTSPGEKLEVSGNVKASGWIGRDSSNYITFDETNSYIDFYAGGNWVARMESDGDLHVKGDVIAFSDIFNP